MESPVSRANCPHYIWGGVCDGWRLTDHPGLSIIEERVPPGAAEHRHHHRHARQFFYVLTGAAVLEIEGTEHVVAQGQGLEVPPGRRHQFMNRSATDVVFLVVSSPATKGDRIEEPA